MPSEPWTWPDALDALVAAPRHHMLLLEDDHLRVLDTRVGPGETVPLHTHRWPGVLYLLSWSDFVRRDEHGAVMLDSHAAGLNLGGKAVWSAALGPHTLENTGHRELRALAIERKHG